METNTYLFIGGCADGQQIRVHDDGRPVECHPDQFRSSVEDSPRAPGDSFSKIAIAKPAEIYRPMRFYRDANHVITVYVCSGISAETVRRRLSKVQESGPAR